ncbi:MAG: hypothetical protein QOF27_2474, partial [Gaiellaceae bacterium]|nr:hypothetical protein [Gaiellaceae bacterium]
MDRALVQLFEQQHGVVRTAQALLYGESYETIERRVANNDWARPLPRIVAPCGVELSFAGRLSAAALSIGGRIAFGGSTAAALWRFPGVDPPDRLHVIVDDSRQASSCELMHVQRRSALLDRTYVRDGWPVVSVEAA